MFFHRTSSFLSVSTLFLKHNDWGIFMDTLENEKGHALLNPLLATGLTQLFTLLGVVNKMIPILRLCLNSFLDFISSSLYVGRNSMDKPQG